MEVAEENVVTRLLLIVILLLTNADSQPQNLLIGDWRQIVLTTTGDAEEHWGGAKTGRISGMATLADSLNLVPAQGQIAFDDAQLLKIANPTFVLDRAAAVITPPGSMVGLSSRLGVSIHFLKDDRALDLAKGAGFSFVRIDLPWAELEKRRAYDFAPFDGLMRSLEARGMGVLWVLDYGHPEHGGKSPQSKEDVAAYSRYAAAVVAHFKGHNARFEIWNEPNGKQFLANPAIYPDLLRAALDMIRLQDPDAAVSTGGTSGFDFPFLASMLGSGSAQKASAIAVHPYRNSAPESLDADLTRIQALIQRSLGPNRPVWDTEWGYSSYGKRADGFSGGGHSDLSRYRQAVLVTRECLTVWALGLPLAVVYDLRDDGSDPFNREDNFGLLNQDNSDKPAMKAIRVLTSIAQNHTSCGIVRDAPYGVHAIRLNGAGDIVFVVWDEDSKVRPRIRLPRDELVSVSDMLGKPIAVDSDSAVVLEERMGPVYARLKRH